MGVLEDPAGGRAITWQAGGHGGWNWEIGYHDENPYIAVAGPTEIDQGWSVTLGPQDSFESEPATVAVGRDFEAAIDQLIAHRRSERSRRDERGWLPIVYNDYLNTLRGDPTEAVLEPLIDAAASVGAEVFCIDAGWYANDQAWWGSVGAWTESTTRFPKGLKSITDRIISLGMTPGLWLEPEAIGISSSLVDTLPLSAFFVRAGHRVQEQSRYHLNFAEEEVRQRLDEVVDRLISDYRIGYFKFDYNINPGTGTDVVAASPGHGALLHARGYLQWLDGVLNRHPSIILENCASGALRSDPSLTSRASLQSTSDQEDIFLYPPIAAGAPLGVLPEQAANWASPQPGMARESALFTIITGLAGPLYLSGHLDKMSDEELEVVSAAVSYAKQARTELAETLPFWPIGLPKWDAPWVVLGLRSPSTTRLFVWCRADREIEIPLPKVVSLEATFAFPADQQDWSARWDSRSRTLVVRSSSSPSARVLQLNSVVFA